MPAPVRDARLASIGLFRCQPWWRLDPSRTCRWRDLDLWLLLDGAGEVDTPEGVIVLAPGSCLVLRGGEPYRFRPAAGRWFRHWFAHFSFLDPAGRALPPQADPPPRHRRLDSHLLLAGLLERAAEAHAAGDPACQRWFAAALLEVARADAQAGRPAVAEAGAIDALMTQLREDPAGAPTVAAMAAGLGLGADRFTRLFRRRSGLSPRAFLVQARLERARHLLRDSALAVGEVAAACGYADPAFFCRHFTAHQGVSPGAWRRQRRGG